MSDFSQLLSCHIHSKDIKTYVDLTGQICTKSLTEKGNRLHGSWS